MALKTIWFKRKQSLQFSSLSHPARPVRLWRLALAFVAILLWQLFLPPMQVSANDVTGVSGFIIDAAHVSGYPIRPDETYRNTGNIPGEFEDARFIISDTQGSLYIAFCADYALAPPVTPDDHEVFSPVVNETSALAVAMASQSYGAKLSNSEFNAIFGITGDDLQRALILSAFVWAMETTNDISIAADVSSWPSGLDSLRGTLEARIPVATYETVANGIKAMMDAYDPGGANGISGVSSIYDEITGKFTFSHTGYGSFTAGLTVMGEAEIYINGVKYSAANGLPISPDDNVYIYSGKEIKITVSTISPLILQNGSIRGDLLENVSNEHYQNLLTGHAQFGYATSEIVTAGAAAGEVEIPFIKSFDIAYDDTARDSIFSFTIQEVDSSGTPVSGGFSDTKTLDYEEGRRVDLHFSFTVSGLAPATGGSDGLSPRYYYYKVTESTPGAGWSIIGANPIFARVEVTSSGSPSVEYSNSVGGPWGVAIGVDNKFNNQYATPVHVEYVNIEAGKSVTGAWLGSRAFNVVLTQVENLLDLTPIPEPNDYSETKPITVSADGTGTVNFTSIGFVTPGKYYYKISEAPGTGIDWLFDETVYVAEVVVDDDMAISLTYFRNGKEKVDGVIFTNYYLSADFEVNIDKVVYGTYTAASPTFSFLIREIDKSGNPTGAVLTGETVKTISNAEVRQPGSATFLITGVSPGVHYYEVIETAAATTGWSYDTGRLIVRAEVITGKEDTLIPGSAQYYKKIFVDYPVHPDNPATEDENFSNAKNSPIFTNVYTSADTNITITKTIAGTGNPGYVNQQFLFDVEQVDENGEPVSQPEAHPPVSSLLTTAGSATSRTVNLQLRGLTAGTYYYRVTERDSGGAGWRYDTAPLYIKVNVEGNSSNDSLAVNVEVFDGIAGAKTDMTFRNSYFLGSAMLQFTKKYAGTSYPAKSFSYELALLSGDGDNPTHMSLTGEKATLPGSSGAGVKAFSGNSGASTGNTLNNVAILRNLAPGAYYYRITEQPNTTAGVNWNGWDHGAETLYCKVTVSTSESLVEWWNDTFWVSGSSESAEFRTITNRYTNSAKGSGVITLGGVKIIGGDELPPDNPQFSFTLTELNSANAGDVKDGGITRTAVSYGSVTGAAFTFPFIHLEIEHDTRIEYKDYYFEIQETAGGGEGWSNDATVYVLTVRVWGYVEILSNPTVVEVIEVNGKLFGSSHPDYDTEHPGDTAFTFGDLEFINTYNTDEPPGETEEPPGETEEPPGETENPPGETENPPGETENPPGETENPPGETENPPDETEEPPGETEHPHVPGETEGSDNPGDPEYPYVPGGNDREVPPNPTVPGNELFPDDDGWIEYDPEGVPVGRWDWDDEEETWVFDPFPPLAELPATGLETIKSALFAALGVGLLSAGTVMRLKVKRKTEE